MRLGTDVPVRRTSGGPSPEHPVTGPCPLRGEHRWQNRAGESDAVVEAARNLGVSRPIVVRLEGTNVEEGQRVLRESGLNFIVANGMKDAAEKAVAAAA